MQIQLIKNISNLNRNICFILSFVCITSCANDGNKGFNLLEEARTFFYEELGLKETEKKENKKINVDKSVTTKKTIKEDSNIQIIEENNEPPKKYQKKSANNALQNEEMESDSRIIESEKINRKIMQSRLLKKEEISNIEDRIDVARIKEGSIKKFLKDKDFLMQEKSIKVGVLLPLSGDKSNIGKVILKALEIGIFLNKDADIELIIKDTNADPLTTIEAFEELLSMNVKNFIGPLFASSLLAIEDKIIKNNVRVFALTNNTNMANNNIWVFGVDPQQQASSIIKFAIKEGLENIAFLLPNNEYGALILKTIKNKLMEENLTPSRIEFFDNDMDSQVNAARKISNGFIKYNEKVNYLKEQNKREDNLKEFSIEHNIEDLEKPFDGVFIAASGQNLTILASQLQYFGVDPKNISYLGIASWERESILREPALNGGYFSATSNGFQENVKNIYNSYFKEEMTSISMLAYDVLALISMNIKEYQKIDINNLVNEDGFIGLRGLFRLKRNGIVERTFQIKKIKNKRFLVYEEAPQSF